MCRHTRTLEIKIVLYIHFFMLKKEIVLYIHFFYVERKKYVFIICFIPNNSPCTIKLYANLKTVFCNN